MCLRLVFAVMMTMYVLFFSVEGLEIRPKIRRSDSFVSPTGGLGDVLMKSFQDSVKPGRSEKERRANLALIRMMRRRLKQEDWVNEGAYKSDQPEGFGDNEHEAEGSSIRDGGEDIYVRSAEYDRGEAPSLG